MELHKKLFLAFDMALQSCSCLSVLGKRQNWLLASKIYNHALILMFSLQNVPFAKLHWYMVLNIQEFNPKVGKNKKIDFWIFSTPNVFKIVSFIILGKVRKNRPIPCITLEMVKKVDEGGAQFDPPPIFCRVKPKIKFHGPKMFLSYFWEKSRKLTLFWALIWTWRKTIHIWGSVWGACGLFGYSTTT